MAQGINRKQNIVDAALALFAEKGYDGTSTQQIARRAEVSEALIFKHFENKESLLNHIIRTGYKRIIEHNRGMLQEKDPLQFIYRIIELPYQFVRDEPLFWKLQTRLLDMPASMQPHEHFMQPVYTLIRKAFADLDYSHPEQETELLLLIIETLWKTAALNTGRVNPELLTFIKAKYGPQKGKPGAGNNTGAGI